MSDSALVIAVDSSTTSTKAIVVDAEGTVLAEGRAEVPMSTPRVDFYEQDPREWWRTTNAAIKEAVSNLSGPNRGRITHVCATIQRQSFALVDHAGQPLRPGILWLDGRAAEQVRRLGSEDLHVLSGFQPDVTPSFYKIAWLRDNEPEVLDRAAKVVGVHAYLVYAMTGRWVDSRGTADSLGLFDMSKQEFSDELLDLVGLRREQLPELVDSASSIDIVLPSVSKGWGLTQAVTLVASCGDGQAAALGAGAIGTDEAYLNMGTALVAGVHSPTYEHAGVFRTDAAGLPGQYVLEIVQNSGAYLAGWFRQELGDPTLEGKPDPALEAAAAAVPAGCGGLVTLPYWNAVQSPHWDPIAKGAIVGLAGAHTRGVMYRSVLEGISIEMASNLKGLQETTGVPLTTIRVVGGGQRSPLWRQIMTDACGVGLTEVNQSEVSAMGAAVMAMAAAGAHDSIESAAKAMASLGSTSEPDMATHERYNELGAIQAQVYPAMKDVFEAQYEFSKKYPLND
ncbi:xylulokinase [Propionibacteriaceae bacterium G57]|uniref:xylulokinase n=1 Tax=Aestuariimicrobium sp. G57 TaxID=3418485 RepID=UPI003DA6ED7D